ncbi:MAG TPA: hypothetical protein VKO61_00980 [Candidatus Paceibacterota bacterium]|nr:hypothetical protein [Candidatus Paceibacterota bacterium]
MNVKRYVGLDNTLTPMKVATNLINSFPVHQREKVIYSLTYFSKKKNGLAEEDWLETNFAIKFGPAGEHESLSHFPEHQILKKSDGIYVPVLVDGLRDGDCIGVVLDGNNTQFLERLAEKVAQQDICLMGIEKKDLEGYDQNQGQKSERIKYLLEHNIRRFCVLEPS